MSDPTTLHPPGLDARVLVKIGLAIIACLAAVLGVAVAAIFGQIGNARVEVGSVWTGLSAINDRLGRIEKTVDETRATLDRLARNEQRNEQRTVSVTPNVIAGFYVTAQEAEFIRELFENPAKERDRDSKDGLVGTSACSGHKAATRWCRGQARKAQGVTLCRRCK